MEMILFIHMYLLLLFFIHAIRYLYNYATYELNGGYNIFRAYQ